MTRNVGRKERYARLAIAAAAAAAAARRRGWQRTALGAVAVAGLGTSIARYCPMNQLVGRRLSDTLDDFSASSSSNR